MFVTLGANIGMYTLAQLLLPPTFLHFYGIRRYGEWLVLAATASYLGTLNFGITTYASNELTMLRKRGEMTAYRELQGSTLAMLLCLVGVGTLVSATVFLLPITKLLHLTLLSRMDAAGAAFFLCMMTMCNVLGGYYNNLFMVVEQTHRGTFWAMMRWSCAALICVPLAVFRLPFAILAMGQFCTVVTVTLLTILDLKRRMRDLPLGLGGANWKTAKASLAPSGMFAMIMTQTFLLFQAPVILLNWLVGPEVVVLFTICRTIFSTARQMLQMVTNAIAPEITFSFAERDMKKLLNIFHYSEKVVFGVIPIANLGALLFAPVLLQIWLHKPFLFDPWTYGLMALVSGTMSMRDHKQFFQFSTNTHERLSMIVFFGNLLMISISIPFTMKFGIYGFMGIWLTSEMTQMALIYRENRKLFDNDASINLMPVLKLVLMMLVSLPICAVAVELTRNRSLAMSVLAAVLGMIMLISESYFTFGLKDVWTIIRRKLRGLQASGAPGV